MAGFVVHEPGDSVGVVIRDVNVSERVDGKFLDGRPHDDPVEARDSIPLGHKIALVKVAEGDQVIKYGTSIGRATQAIAAGQHVHTHNLKGERWA